MKESHRTFSLNQSEGLIHELFQSRCKNELFSFFVLLAM